MSVEKRHRIKDIKNDVVRKQTVAGEMLARKMLSELLICTYKNVVFCN